MMKYFNILKHLLSLSPLKYFLFLNIFILDSSLKKKKSIISTKYPDSTHFIKAARRRKQPLY